MTNQELAQEFLRISNIENAFDRVIELKKFKKYYKKSDFYKQTHFSIDKAFSIFSNVNVVDFIHQLNYLLTEENLSIFINKQIAEIHFEDILNKLLYSVDYEQLGRMLQKFIPEATVDTEDVKNIMEQFTGALKQLQR